MILVIVSALYSILSTKMAGYNYLSFTSSQMEILPKEMEWEKRTIIQDESQINDVLSMVKDADLYNGTSIQCDGQNWDLQLLIRRNFAKDDLSWLVCQDKEYAYLKPMLAKNKSALFKTDKQLISKLEVNHSGNN